MQNTVVVVSGGSYENDSVAVSGIDEVLNSAAESRSAVRHADDVGAIVHGPRHAVLSVDTVGAVIVSSLYGDNAGVVTDAGDAYFVVGDGSSQS